MIPGYSCLPHESGITHSIEKINDAARDLLESYHDNINIIKSPCRNENETLGYRCSCAFQVIELPKDEEDGETLFFYAMRQNQKPIILTGEPCFPIAIPQIQHLMNAFLNDVLNKKSTLKSSTCIIKDRFEYKYQHLRRSLSSVSFHASWDGKTDAFITLNYSAPFCDHITEWRNEAQHVCDVLLASSPFILSGLIGRSKKKKAVVFSKYYLSSNEWNFDLLENKSIQPLSNHTSIDNHNFQNIHYDSIPITLRDTIYINYPLNPSNPSSTSRNKEGNMNTQTNNSKNELKIQYRKPLDAFHHPNGKVMMKALDWMLKKIMEICISQRHTRLLELYCGCGAHTIPIAKLNAFHDIVAVEMDSRLVNACHENVILNNIKHGFDSTTDDHEANAMQSSYSTRVNIVKGDAADIIKFIIHKKKIKAKQILNKNSNESLTVTPLTIKEQKREIEPISYHKDEDQSEHILEKPQSKVLSTHQKPWYTLQFDVLLVDPPRQGLGDTVCEFAVQANEIQHIIYISCGRKALQRDLNILKKVFDVRECCLMDLFPRTVDAVESLVHLIRRQ